MKRDISLRTEGPRPAFSPAGTLLGCGFLFLLGLGTYWTARLAWADHLSRSVELSDRCEAVRLVPSATLYARLADKREDLGGPFREYLKSLQL